VNDLLTGFLILINVVSIIVIVFLWNKVKHLRLKIANRPDHYDVTELLQDLVNNGAIIEVKRIDPRSIFKRSVL